MAALLEDLPDPYRIGGDRTLVDDVAVGPQARRDSPGARSSLFLFAVFRIAVYHIPYSRYL